MSNESENGAPRLIVNADDYGMSPGINWAVEQLHRRGRLTSASLIVNTPWSKDALVYSAAEPTLRVGVHLNLSIHAPLLPARQVPTLVNGPGQFYSVSAFLMRLLMGLIDMAEVEAEWRAQIEACLAQDIFPGHIDTHMHLHAVPVLGNLVAGLAREYGIKVVRNPDPGAVLLPPLSESGPLPAAVRSPISQLAHSALRLAGGENAITFGEFKHAPSVIYLRWCVEHGRDPYTSFMQCLDLLSGGTAEVITHPATIDQFLPRFSNYVHGRQRELDLLLSQPFTQLLEEGQVTLLEGKRPERRVARSRP
jgi:chitin disaccharide deacetylase